MAAHLTAGDGVLRVVPRHVRLPTEHRHVLARPSTDRVLWVRGWPRCPASAYAAFDALHRAKSAPRRKETTKASQRGPQLRMLGRRGPQCTRKGENGGAALGLRRRGDTDERLISRSCQSTVKLRQAGQAPAYRHQAVGSRLGGTGQGENDARGAMTGKDSRRGPTGRQVPRARSADILLATERSRRACTRARAEVILGAGGRMRLDPRTRRGEERQ